MFQADFFVTYILTDGLSGFSLEILQPGLLCWDAIKSCTYGRGKEKTPYLYSLPYYRIIPLVSLSVLIGIVYAVVAPLLLPFLIGYFLLGYAVFINQVDLFNFAFIIQVYYYCYYSLTFFWPLFSHTLNMHDLKEIREKNNETKIFIFFPSFACFVYNCISLTRG